MPDTFLTLTAAGEASLTEKRSRFLAFAHPVHTEGEVKEMVAEYRRKFHDARHVCFAYAIGPEGDHTRANDDGEPSGTAGRPILGQIRSKGLTDCLVVVVRYFGGVKLGTPGLIAAYKTAAALCLEAVPVAEKTVMGRFRVDIPYTSADMAMRFIREGGGEMVAHEYTDSGMQITVEVRRRDLDTLRERVLSIHTVHEVK